MAQARTLSNDELLQVLGYVGTRAHAARNRAIMMLTHLAGLRVSEVACLRWSDVTASDGTIKDERVHLGLVQTVRLQKPDFSPTPSRRTAPKKSGGSETKRGLRRVSGVGGHGVSQEPIAKSPAWCGALSA